MHFIKKNWQYIGIALFLLLGLAACERHGEAQESKPPVEVAVQRVSEETRVVVTNNTLSLVTAIFINLHIGARTQRITRDSRITDDPMIAARGMAMVYEDSYPIDGAEVLAAIFADGTTYGDPKWIAAMMNGRHDVLETLETLHGRLCQASAKKMSRDEALQALNAGWASNPPDNPDERAKWRTQQWTVKRVSVMFDNGASINDVKQMVTQLGEQAAGDNVKRPDGRPYTTFVNDKFSCGTVY